MFLYVIILEIMKININIFICNQVYNYIWNNIINIYSYTEDTDIALFKMKTRELTVTYIDRDILIMRYVYI
jgi:hypothetical protein